MNTPNHFAEPVPESVREMWGSDLWNHGAETYVSVKAKCGGNSCCAPHFCYSFGVALKPNDKSAMRRDKKFAR